MANKGTHWVTEPHQEINIVLGDKGYAAAPPVTVMQALAETVRKFGNEKALALKRPVNVSFYFFFFSVESLMNESVGSSPRELEVLDME